MTSSDYNLLAKLISQTLEGEARVKFTQVLGAALQAQNPRFTYAKWARTCAGEPRAKAPTPTHFPPPMARFPNPKV